MTKPVQWATFTSYIEFLLRLSANGRAGEAAAETIRQRWAKQMQRAREDIRALVARCDKVAVARGMPLPAANEIRALSVALSALALGLGASEGADGQRTGATASPANLPDGRNVA